MKRFLVRFLLKGGPHNLDVVMSDTDTRDTISKWNKFIAELGAVGVFTGYDQTLKRHWTIRWEEISTIIACDYDEMLQEQERAKQRAGQQAPASPPYHGWGSVAA